MRASRALEPRSSLRLGALTGASVGLRRMFRPAVWRTGWPFTATNGPPPKPVSPEHCHAPPPTAGFEPSLRDSNTAAIRARRCLGLRVTAQRYSCKDDEQAVFGATRGPDHDGRRHVGYPQQRSRGSIRAQPAPGLLATEREELTLAGVRNTRATTAPRATWLIRTGRATEM